MYIKDDNKAYFHTTVYKFYGFSLQPEPTKGYVLYSVMRILDLSLKYLKLKRTSSLTIFLLVVQKVLFVRNFTLKLDFSLYFPISETSPNTKSQDRYIYIDNFSFRFA